MDIKIMTMSLKTGFVENYAEAFQSPRNNDILSGFIAQYLDYLLKVSALVAVMEIAFSLSRSPRKYLRTLIIASPSLSTS